MHELNFILHNKYNFITGSEDTTRHFTTILTEHSNDSAGFVSAAVTWAHE
jgi:hypothetical protein